MQNINHLTIIDSAYHVDFSNGEIKGKSIFNSVKYLKDLPNIFEDNQAFLSLDGDKISKGGRFNEEIQSHSGPAGWK